MTMGLDVAKLIEEFGWPAFAIVARTLAMCALMPVVGEAMIPMRFRLALGCVFGISIVFDQIAGGQTLQDTPPLQLLFFEIFIGVCIGIGFRLIVHAIQTTAAIAAQSFSVAQMAGAINGEPLPAVGYFLLLGCLCGLLSLGFGESLFMIIQSSFVILPLGSVPTPTRLGENFLALTQFSFDLALNLALPFCAVSLFYNFIMGALNKVMPQLMVMLVGAPIGMLALLLLLTVASPVIINVWAQNFIGLYDLRWLAP